MWIVGKTMTTALNVLIIIHLDLISASGTDILFMYVTAVFKERKNGHNQFINRFGGHFDTFD